MTKSRELKTKVVDLSSLDISKMDSAMSKGNFKRLLERSGYKVEAGILMKNKRNKLVSGIDGDAINFKEEPDVSFVAGSHIFVRNVAELAHVLTDKGIIKLEKKEG